MRYGTFFIDAERELAKLKLFEKKEWLKLFDIRRVIVEVHPGETEEDAWSRHLKKSPGDRWVNIRIFNRRPPT